MLNKTKRKGVIMLALVLLAGLFVLAGCSKGAKLKGMQIVIGNWWADYDVNTYKPSNDMEEKMLAYRTKIQKDFGFTIQEKAIGGWGEMQQLAATSIMAGDPVAQVIVLQPNWAMALYNRNLLYPVSDSKSVDFNSTKPVEWNRVVKDSFTFNGKSYAFAVGYGGSLHASVVFFNKRLFREAGIDPDSLYDMQKNGTWTWDAFMDISKKLTRDINNDGIMDTYAMTHDLSTEVLDAIVASNGANYIERDSKGLYVNGTSSPEFMEALQFAMRLKTEGVLMPRPEISNWDWYKAMFTDGKVAMRIEPQWVINELQNMVDDWGMVVFPKGPRVSDYKVYTDENIMVVPSTYTKEQVDNILYAVQLWYTPIDNDPNEWKDWLYNQYRDSRAVDETIAIIRDPKYSVWKNYINIPGLERGDIAWQMWWHEGDPSQLVEQVSQTWNALIDDTNGIITKQ